MISSYQWVCKWPLSRCSCPKETPIGLESATASRARGRRREGGMYEQLNAKES